jgi:hypothetical protein
VVEDDDEVCLLVPPRTCHLRAIRLVAAEAGGRAGLSDAALDDLRVAVDELCYTLMDATDQRLLLRVLVRDGRVIVRGSARQRRGATAPRLPSISEAIVSATTDHHALTAEGDQLSFVAIKRGPDQDVRP